MVTSSVILGIQTSSQNAMVEETMIAENYRLMTTSNNNYNFQWRYLVTELYSCEQNGELHDRTPSPHVCDWAT